MMVIKMVLTVIVSIVMGILLGMWIFFLLSGFNNKFLIWLVKLVLKEREIDIKNYQHIKSSRKKVLEELKKLK